QGFSNPQSAIRNPHLSSRHATNLHHLLGAHRRAPREGLPPPRQPRRLPLLDARLPGRQHPRRPEKGVARLHHLRRRPHHHPLSAGPIAATVVVPECSSSSTSPAARRPSP